MYIYEFVEKMNKNSFYSIKKCKIIADNILSANGNLETAYNRFEIGGIIMLNQYIYYL